MNWLFSIPCKPKTLWIRTFVSFIDSEKLFAQSIASLEELRSMVHAFFVKKSAS